MKGRLEKRLASLDAQIDDLVAKGREIEKAANELPDDAPQKDVDAKAEELKTVAAQVKELKAERDKVAASLEDLETLDDAENTTATVPGRPDASNEPGQSPRPNASTTLPAEVKKWGRLRYISAPKGEDPYLVAYRMGQFFLACYGLEGSQKYCAENGIPIMAAEPHKGSDNDRGGVFVPDEWDNLMIDLRERFSVFRNRARLVPMMRDTKKRRRRVTGLTANFVGEGKAIPTSRRKNDFVQLVAKKLGVLTTYTNELSEDAVISIADDLAGEIAYAFAKKEDECGFNGDGSSTFGGIEGVRTKIMGLSATRADIAGLVVGSGNNWGALVLSDFTKVIGRLPEFADTAEVGWYCHKTFFGEVMQKLIYAAGGSTAEIEDGTKRSFLGYPVHVTQTFPKTTGADQLCAAFGDLSMCADYGDRGEMAIQFSEDATVDGVSVFETDEVAIRGTERFDINVHSVGNATAVDDDKEPGPVVAIATAA